jgi:hypothetical protein
VSYPRYFDRNGQPLGTMDWAFRFADWSYKRVAKTKVGDVEVSTVWLGLDHGYEDTGPLIFETLVFGGPLDGEMERYATEAEALAGHEAMVARVERAGP